MSKMRPAVVMCSAGTSAYETGWRWEAAERVFTAVLEAAAVTGRARAHGELRQRHVLVSKLSPPRSRTAAALRTAAAAAATSHVCAARHDNVHRSTESRRRHHQNDFSLGIPRIASSARCYPSLYSARSARVHTHTHPPPWLHCASRALTQWGAGGRMDEQSSYQRRAGRGLRLLEGDWPLRRWSTVSAMSQCQLRPGRSADGQSTQPHDSRRGAATIREPR